MQRLHTTARRTSVTCCCAPSSRTCSRPRSRPVPRRSLRVVRVGGG
jgi:hypothetical protein